MSDDGLGPPATETFTQDDVEVLEHVRTYDGYFKIDRYTLKHKLHQGGWSAPLSRELFERGHAVAVFLYDPDLERVVFVEQFRVGALAAMQADAFGAEPHSPREPHSPWLLECVAGIIDAGESPKDVAKRECLEEANCHVHDLTQIGHYLVSPGGTSESVRLYCARVDASTLGGVHGLDHEHEDIRVLSVPTAKALAWLDEGRYINAMTLIAMQWFKINRRDLKARWT